MKPFPTSVLTVPIEIFATTTKICTRGGSTQTHDPDSVTTHTPAYSQPMYSDLESDYSNPIELCHKLNP
ncbi:Cornichon protein [Metschnikowia aff. pulcherrima]|uniref:Cornichon protein n=1 Tax=Metschnikowia aff. pulcherrima TaxID=2163413 RepID=A0A4P6XWM3_9ASCO|nr:Cornichon protein [Metschnikowia aff. pulcherrima]